MTYSIYISYTSLTLSIAKILAHINTNTGCSSRDLLCSSFSMYGNIPTDNACNNWLWDLINPRMIHIHTRWTADGPRSKNLLRSSRACNRWSWLNNTCGCINILESKRLNLITCKTIGSCSGGFLYPNPLTSHTWNAFSWYEKKSLGCREIIILIHAFLRFILDLISSRPLCNAPQLGQAVVQSHIPTVP